jgi:hypothetical protein
MLSYSDYASHAVRFLRLTACTASATSAPYHNESQHPHDINSKQLPVVIQIHGSVFFQIHAPLYRRMQYFTVIAVGPAFLLDRYVPAYYRERSLEIYWSRDLVNNINNNGLTVHNNPTSLPHELSFIVSY